LFLFLLRGKLEITKCIWGIGKVIRGAGRNPLLNLDLAFEIGSIQA